MRCKITVGIPAYNAQDTLRAAVESVRANTYADYEILIVNDGSTDGTEREAHLLAEQDSRIRVISQKNGGPGSARNRVIREAAGEYLAFIDADDIVAEEYLASLLTVMEEDDLDWAVCGYFSGKETGGKVEAVQPHPNAFPQDVIYRGKEIEQQVIPAVFYGPGKNNLPSMAMGMYRLRVIRDNALFVDETIVFGEDMEFNFRLSRCIAGFAYLTRRMYYYIAHGDSVTVSFKNDGEDRGRLRHLAELERARQEMGLAVCDSYRVYMAIQICHIVRALYNKKDKKERREGYVRFWEEADRTGVSALFSDIHRANRELSLQQRLLLRGLSCRRPGLFNAGACIWKLKQWIKRDADE